MKLFEWPRISHKWKIVEAEYMMEDKISWSKGTCQKRFSGIRPLRGRGGYPPFLLRKKTFFFSH